MQVVVRIGGEIPSEIPNQPLTDETAQTIYRSDDTIRSISNSRDGLCIDALNLVKCVGGIPIGRYCEIFVDDKLICRASLRSIEANPLQQHILDFRRLDAPRWVNISPDGAFPVMYLPATEVR